MKITTNFIKQTKRHFSASGSILLPLALKWRLVGVVATCTLSVLGTQSVLAASLEITIPSNLSVNVTPSTSGTIAESKPVELKISSNAPWGYTLSIKSNTNDNTLINGQNELPSISGQLDATKDFANNTWGFKFTNGSKSNNKYWPGPNGVSTILDETKGIGETTLADKKYDFVIATKVNNDLAAGTYTGSFTFTAVANAVNYTINYDDNNGAAGPGKVTGQTQEKFVKLSNLEPKRNDDHEYVFLGWCDRKVNDNGTCDGTIYQPGNDYEITASNQETTLYAIWDWITMQNWDDCSKNLEVNKQFTLVDSRDNRAYFVAKLVDGNCWMTENLDFDIDSNETYTKDNTDLGYANVDGSNNITGDGNYEWKSDRSTYETGDTTWDGSNNRSYDPGNYCWKGEQTRHIKSEESYFEADSRECDPHDSSHYHIGNYYCYDAAVAQNDTSAHTTNKQAYNTSICPAGWQLPNVDGNKSYQALHDAAKAAGQTWYAGYIGSKTENQTTNNKSTVHEYPFYFIYSGLWGGRSRRFGGYVWYRSNAVYSSILSYVFMFSGDGHLTPIGTSGYRQDAFPVRCVSRQ